MALSAIARPRPASPEYQQWCRRLIRQRFWLAIGLTAIYWSVAGLADFYELFIAPESFQESLQRNGQTDLFETARQNFIAHKIVLIALLTSLVPIWRSAWGRQHPEIMLVLLPWAIAFIPEMVLGALFGIPRAPSIVMFMAQAIIAPVFWRLHLLAQIVPLLFYFLVYPLLRLATFGDRSIYSFSYTSELVLLCILCEVGVYLYEQSKQAELEANRQLQLYVHTITHDLRTPIMGSLMLLKAIRQASPTHRPVEISRTEMSQLVQGSERLLSLMNSLLAPQASVDKEPVVRRQAVNLSEIVNIILKDFQDAFTKHHIQVDNRVREDLPLLYVDIQQTLRVFKNLIDNAVSYNPSGISLTLDATELHSLIRIAVRDDGMGISSAQQKTIFEPYTRGRQTQYLPGLGLGLYICRQVVLAHGGTIGVERLDQGTAFWFTLPIMTTEPDRQSNHSFKSS